MKKNLFLLSLMLMSVLGLSAQKTWNFSDAQWYSGLDADDKPITTEYTTATTIDGLTMTPAADKKIVVDANSKTVDDIHYIARLKFPGSAANDGGNTLSFAVDGPCNIKIVLQSGNSDEDRTLNLCAGSYDKENPFATMSALGASPQACTCEYTGEATTIYVGSSKSGINLYAIYVTPKEEPTEYVYSIVGDFFDAETVGGWENDQDMTQSEDNENIYTLVVENFNAQAKKYEYKLRANHQWGLVEIPESGNQDFVFGTEEYPAGVYDLTFTADIENKTLELVPVLLEPEVEPIGVITFGNANPGRDFVTDPFVVSGVVNLEADLKDGTHLLLNHDSEGNPNGKFWTGNIAGAWANTAAVNAMNEALGTEFVDADFAAGTNLATCDPGPGDSHSYLNLTFTNAKKNTLELYAAVTGRNGALDNVTVTGLTNVIISYAVGDGDGFVSEPTFSPDVLGITLVKIQGYLGDDKQVTVTSTSMAGEASAKNGFQMAAYTFTDEELPLVIESMAVVGTFPGMTWEPTEGVAMTQDPENADVWTVTMEGVEVEGKQYEYKVTANGKWGVYEIPAQGNQDFVFGTDEYPAGVYNLTFTANTSENTLELVAEKTGTTTDFVEITVTDAVSDNNGNYITFSSPYALDFTGLEGIKAYTGKKNILYDTTNFKDVAEVILTPVDKVPAFTGVLIKASEAKTYQVPVASQPVDALADNDFVAAIEKTDLFPLCDGYIKGVATLQTAEYEVFDWNTYENVNETGTGFFLLDVPAEEGVDFLEEGDVYLPIVANETCNEVDEVKYYCHYVKLVFTDVELPVAENIAALKAMDNETIATLKFAENTLVTYVGTDFIAIEDNTGGIFLQNPGIDVTVGKTLTGQLTGQLDKASTYPVLSNCTQTDASTIVISEETTELNPAVVTFNQAFGDDHLMRLVKLENVTVVKEDEYSSMCKFVDQEGTELEINDLLGALTLEMMDLKDGDLLLEVEGYAYIIDESSFYANWLGTNQFQPVRMTKQHTYSIVGEFFATDDNDGWTNDQDMVQSEDNENVYTLTVDKFTAEARTYEYKLRADHVWGVYELPAQGNQNWVFGTEGYPAGDYKLTFTANVAENTLELTVEALDAPSTGINEVSTDWTDGNTYNLNGQRIDTPRKGVVIRNGKKVIIK